MNRGKRSLLIMEIFAGFVGLVSAWGSNCITFDREASVAASLERAEKLAAETGDPLEVPYNFAIVAKYEWLWYITTTLTYLAAIATVVLIWALIKKKEWFYMPAVITALVGAITGWIPYILIVMDGGNTPSFLRAGVYTIVLIMLLLPPIKQSLISEVGQNVDSSAPKEDVDPETSVSSVLGVVGLAIMMLSIGAVIAHDPSWVTWGISVAIASVLIFYIGLSLTLASLIYYMLGRKSTTLQLVNA